MTYWLRHLIRPEIFICGWRWFHEKRLRKTAKQNIKFFDFLEPKEVMELVSKAKAFVHAGIEDFGIAPVEAQSCGTPVIAYNLGGLSETVIDGKTGILLIFKQQMQF